MRIYDRYNTDSSQERRRQRDRIAKSRRGLRRDYNLAQNWAVVCFMAWVGLCVILLAFRDALPGFACMSLGILTGIGFVISLILALNLERIGDDGEPDLYIYGMKNGCFLLLNQLYETLRRIDPAELREICILSAMRPTTRQRRYRIRWNHENTAYDFFGEKQKNGRIRSYPMAVLCTKQMRTGWSYIDCPVFRRRLNSLLSFVPMGEGEEHFVFLLQKSSCPVVVDPKVYRRWQAHLDALFARSGMDRNRLVLMKERSKGRKK